MPAPNFRGGCLLQIFGGGFLHFSEYGHRSAGTHPTGMHSCLESIYLMNEDGAEDLENVLVCYDNLVANQIVCSSMTSKTVCVIRST